MGRGKVGNLGDCLRILLERVPVVPPVSGGPQRMACNGGPASPGKSEAVSPTTPQVTAAQMP
eukprot:1384292-Amphidinium_carterae.1